MHHILPLAERTPPPKDRSAFGVAVLTSALIFSLLLNLTVGVFVVRERNEAEALRDRVNQLQREVDNLRAGRGGGSVPSLAEISADVERLRGLAFQEPVDPQVLSPAALQDRVRSLFMEDNPREDFEAIQRVLETLGVIEPGLGLWDVFVSAHEEQVAGFYDPKERELVVQGDIIEEATPFTRVILAHELTHALTDQHFDLTRLDRLRSRGRDEAAAAYLALVEGDATLLMSTYISEVLTSDEQAALVFEQAQVPSEAFDEMPAFLQRVLLFPYTEGFRFVQALHARGGFAAVDEAYRDPPVSTEQILHPERYLDVRDDPRRVSLPAIRPALGDGWRRLIGGEVGEFDLRLIADLQVRPPGGLPAGEARRAAQGWDGGAYAAFGSQAGTLLAALVAWDSLSEAEEAQTLFGRWLPTRYGNQGQELDVGAGQGRGWQGPDGAGMVLRSGDHLLLLLGPDVDSVRAARSAFEGF